MPKPKKPATGGAKRKRGRPTERITISPEQAESVLDSWLGKSRPKPPSGPSPVRSRVSTKRGPKPG